MRGGAKWGRAELIGWVEQGHRTVSEQPNSAVQIIHC